LLSPCCHAESPYVRGENVDGDVPPPGHEAREISIKTAPKYERRRECSRCGRRFWTEERVMNIDLPSAGRGQLVLFIK
jgi:uncharacterized protein with PIN domain